MRRIYDSAKIAKKTITAIARKFKTLPEKVRQIVKVLERDGTIENKHARIRELMYTKFRNVRDIGNNSLLALKDLGERSSYMDDHF